MTSAPTVSGDLVITVSSIGDNGAVDMHRGVIRAYDARTGTLRWTWDPIPWAEKQQVRTGAANAWCTLTAHPARDLVFIPTGSASRDYFGGARPGNNRWANSVVAPKASSGSFVWGFQVAHHDLWDYVLIDFRGRPAVAVTTKIGGLGIRGIRAAARMRERSDRRRSSRWDIRVAVDNRAQGRTLLAGWQPSELPAMNGRRSTPSNRTASRCVLRRAR